MSAHGPRALRDALGAFLTGVTVVTTCDADGKPIGFTANSFTSVSLEPPLVLVCVARTSHNHATLISARGFAVNVLSAGQVDVSNTFARPVEDRFAAVSWRSGPHGSPILQDVSAWFDCAMHKTVDGGDHTILIGEVRAFENFAAPGLGYARGAYVTPTVEAATLQPDMGLVVSALIDHGGAVLLVDDGAGNPTIPTIAVDGTSVSASLEALLASLGIAAAPGFVFSVFEDAGRRHRHICFLCQVAEEAVQDDRFNVLDPMLLAKVGDPAIRAMLQRFLEERSMGQFGFYFGSHAHGKVGRIRHSRADAGQHHGGDRGR